MIECTLQEASELSKKEGGYFWRKDAAKPMKYYYSMDDGYIYDADLGHRFELWAGAFSCIWIYEPPEKSAFQKFWGSIPERHRKKYYDEGVFGFVWNAAIDRIVNDPQIMLTPSEVEKIKALREP